MAYNSAYTGPQVDSAVGQVVGENIPAGSVKFTDGQTFQQKYDAGQLTGPQGPAGENGATGPQGEPGQNATINGVTALTIQGSGKVTVSVEDGVAALDTPNAVQATGGASVQMGSNLGNAPYVIEMTEEDEGDLSASQIGYNNVATGMTATDVQSAITELFTSVSEGKSLLAGAITDKGVSTSADDTFQQMAENVAAIESGASSLSIIRDGIGGGAARLETPAICVVAIGDGAEPMFIVNRGQRVQTETFVVALSSDGTRVSSLIAGGTPSTPVNKWVALG